MPGPLLRRKLVVMPLVKVRDGLIMYGTYSAKVVLIGASGVGKTSLLMRQTGSKFSTGTRPTIGACYAKTQVALDDGGLELQVQPPSLGAKFFPSRLPSSV